MPPIFSPDPYILVLFYNNVNLFSCKFKYTNFIILTDVVDKFLIVVD